MAENFKEFKHQKNSNLSYFIFIVYLLLLIWLILFKFDFALPQWRQSSINLIPFAQSMSVNGEIVYFELVTNAIAFMPLGIYMMVFNKPSNLLLKIVTALLLSLSFEIIQYVLGIGVSDITDVIMNTLGAVLGIIFYMVLSKFLKRSSEKIINIVLLVLIVAFCAIWSFLLIANM